MALCPDCKQLLPEVLNDLFPGQGECRSIWRNPRMTEPKHTQKSFKTVEKRFHAIFDQRQTCWLCCQIYMMCKPLCGSHSRLQFNLPNVRETQDVKRVSLQFEMKTWVQRPEYGEFDISCRVVDTPYSPIDLFIYWKSAHERYSETKRPERRTFRPFNNVGMAESKAFVWDRSSEGCQQNHRESSTPLCPCRVQLIKHWLRMCNTSHDSCRKAAFSGIYPNRKPPRRLIAIEERLEESRIIETAEESEAPIRDYEYATLSHCWGSDPLVTLTRSNYDQFLQRLPFNALGKTFREAMELCEKLRIKYLWIDSLCIVQDSKNGHDWKGEAPRMHEIYGGSLLNIAATASASCSEGLFRSRSQLLRNSNDLAISDEMIVIVREDYNQVGSYLECCYRNAPLLSRGWVLQELFLSPRNLHWTEGQLLWQCNAGCRFEICDLELTGGPISGCARPLDYMYFEPLSNINDVARLDRLWLNIARDFHRTQVTKPEDVLHALGGLATAFGDRYAQLGVQTRYVAGCWEHRILSFLNWILDEGDHIAAGRPHIGYLPSWSWLNAVPGISDTLFMSTTPPAIKIRRVDVEPEDESQRFGPVNHAFLRVRAGTFSVYRIERPWPNDPGMPQESATFFLQHDYAFHFRGNSVKKFIPSFKDRARCTIRFKPDAVLNLASFEPLTCVVFSLRERKEEIVMNGLMVEPVEDVERIGEVRYRRVGSFYLRAVGRDSEEETLASMIRSSDLHWQNLCIT